jgi:hypothetical protein
MATFLLLAFWLFPVVVGAGVSFLVYVIRETRYPQRSHKLALIVAFVLGCVLGAGLEALILFTIGHWILGMFVGVK